MSDGDEVVFPSTAPSPPAIVRTSAPSEQAFIGGSMRVHVGMIVSWILGILLLSESGALADAPAAAAILDRGDTGVCAQSPSAGAGLAAFSYFVTVNGVARDVIVLRSSGDVAADAAAQKCLETAHYKPTALYDVPDEEVWAAKVTWAPGSTATLFTKKQPDSCLGYYPPEAMAAKAQGVTRFSFLATAHGIRDVKLLHSSGDADLDAGAILCIAKMHFGQKYEHSRMNDVPWKANITWIFDPSVPPAPVPEEPNAASSGWTPTVTLHLSAKEPNRKPLFIGPPSCLSQYPEAARKGHSEGFTRIRFNKTSDGKVEDVSVEKSSGDADLDQASIKCVQTSEFQVPEGSHSMDIEWRLNDPLIPVGTPQPCSSFGRVSLEALRGITGATALRFILLPNGKVGKIRTATSSGDQFLDTAAERCILARQFDTSRWKLPADGMSEYLVIDWRKELAPPK